MTVEEYRQRMIDAFHKVDCDELIALVVMPTEKEFEQLEGLLKTHYKKQPCEDCVSKSKFDLGVRAAVEMVEEELTEDFKDGIKTVLELLKTEPPVTPKPRWIPVSERLPEEYGVYLVTIGESTDFCIWNKKEWGWESRKGWEPNIEITAWMPLPEPWKGVSE